MRSAISRGLVLAGLLGLAASAAPAATSYSYFYTTGDQTSFSVAPGGTVTVPLFLQEVNSDQSTNSLLASEQGLYSAGISIQYIGGSPANTITGATANSNVGGFDDPTSVGVVSSPVSAYIMEFSGSAQGALPGPQVDGVSSIYLGSVTFQASSIFGDTTTFELSGTDPIQIGSSVTNSNFYNMDDPTNFQNPPDAASLYTGAATSTLTVSAVPEPAVIGFLAAATPVLLRRTRNRRPRLFARIG